MIDALPTRNAYLSPLEIPLSNEQRISMVDLENIQLFSITVAFNQCKEESFLKKTETYVCLEQ